jgi:5-methylcytosine-specific restriction endonuclease McrA
MGLDMPIRPENRHRYPHNWPEIRATMLERAGHHCEGSPAYPDCRVRNRGPHAVTGSTVVLTVAHLDHNPRNNDPANLRAWCQRCHNTYDAAHRRETRAMTRAAHKSL